MRTIFSLGEKKARQVLLCEWGATHCCYALYDADTKKVGHLHYKTYNTLDIGELGKILQEWKELDPSKVVICSAYPQFVLLPNAYTHEAGKVMEALFHIRQGDVIVTDPVHEWQLTNHYSLPSPLRSELKEAFDTATYYHFFTPSLKVYNGFMAESQVAVHFAPNTFNVLVRKVGQIQLAQMYTYQTPLDVVYYLLKMIEELHLPKEETFILLSGLIEQDSDLYREIHQYFLNLHFVPASSAVADFEQPSHFFTSITNLAACVS